MLVVQAIAFCSYGFSKAQRSFCIIMQTIIRANTGRDEQLRWINAEGRDVALMNWAEFRCYGLLSPVRGER